MNKKIEDLQILRGVAIALVLCGHLSISSTLLELLSKNLSKPFYWGVELFFVLSGFVVTKSLRSKNFDPLHFVTKRFFRLYPAILFLVAFTATLNAIIRNSIYSDFIKELFTVTPPEFVNKAIAILGGYLINVDGKTSYQLAQMWSLSVEFQFYAFTTLIIAFLAFNLREKSYHYTAWLVLVTCLFYRFEVGTNISGFRNGLLAYLINYKFDFMAAGVLLAFVDKAKLTQFFLRLPITVLLPYGVLLTVTLTLMLVRHPLSQNTNAYDTLDGVGMLVTLLGSAFLVGFGSIGGFSKCGAFDRFRSPLIKLGDVSYTVYLFHFSVMMLAWVLINDYFPYAFSHPIYYGIAQLFLTIAILFPVTAYIYNSIELKGMAIGDFIRRIQL